MNRAVFLLGILLGGFAAEIIAAPADTAADVNGVTIAGMGSFEFGQLINYQYRGNDYSRAWLSQSKMRLSARKIITSWLRVALGAEVSAWYETYDKFSNNPFVVPEQFFSVVIHESRAIFAWGNPLSLETGVFPYKYNPDVRNLGEYLFRSGTYPGFLIGEFDFPLERLTGLRVNSRLFGKLDQDLLVTFETKYKPFHDVSVSYLAGFTPHPVIAVGGGVSFAHLLSIDEKETTFKAYDTLRGDSIDLTFRGTKVMARLCFDIKQLFPDGIFGQEDLKLYTEAAILGVNNYRLYYNDILQRIPVMAGFNVPTLKALDVVAFETEWYGSPYPNNYNNAFSVQPQPRPIPDLPQGTYTHDIYIKDNWKWSVYARKTIAGSFSATVQFARDHFRTKSNNPWNVEREESLTKDSHWYWITKLSYKF